MRVRPRLDHFVLSAGSTQNHGWVELGRLYYELWDFGDGRREGCIDKLSASPPRQGIGSAPLTCRCSSTAGWPRIPTPLTLGDQAAGYRWEN